MKLGYIVIKEKIIKTIILIYYFLFQKVKILMKKRKILADHVSNHGNTNILTRER